MKTIFWVSNLFDISLRSAYFSRQIVPELSKFENVIWFRPELISVFENSGTSSYHIHRLPEFIEKESDFVIVYNFEDSYSINLIELYSKNYPGIIILHDQSIFNLKIARLSHGTTNHEFDSLFGKYYPSSELNIGREIVLKKSVSIYQYKYLFLNHNEYKENLLTTFARPVDELKNSSLKQFSLEFLSPSENKLTNPIKNEIKLLLVVSNTLSKVGLDLNRNFESLEKVFILNCNKNCNNWELNYESIASVVNCVEEINTRKIDGVLEVGNFPFHGISSFTFAALANGLPVVLEESFETKELGFKESQIYEKNVGLYELLNRIAEMEPEEIKILDFKNLTRSLIDFIEFNTSVIAKNQNNLTLKRTSSIKKLLDSHLEGIEQSCENIEQIKEDQQSKLINTFNELFGIS